jgi:hypothetical protein
MVMVTTVPLVCNKIMFTQALNVSHRERETTQSVVKRPGSSRGDKFSSQQVLTYNRL